MTKNRGGNNGSGKCIEKTLRLHFQYLHQLFIYMFSEIKFALYISVGGYVGTFRKKVCVLLQSRNGTLILNKLHLSR